MFRNLLFSVSTTVVIASSAFAQSAGALQNIICTGADGNNAGLKLAFTMTENPDELRRNVNIQADYAIVTETINASGTGLGTVSPLSNFGGMIGLTLNGVSNQNGNPVRLVIFRSTSHDIPNGAIWLQSASISLTCRGDLIRRH